MISVIQLSSRGNFVKTENRLKRAKGANFRRVLEKYGREGVAALAAATPKDSGETAHCWSFDILITKNSYVINWKNSNIVDGVPIAIIIQYGHGTRNGGYVEGQDYINPALKPIFERLSNELWREVGTL